MTAQPGINISQVNGEDAATARGLPVRITDSEIMYEQLLVSRAILMVLVGAFYSSDDPQNFIDAARDW